MKPLVVTAALTGSCALLYILFRLKTNSNKKSKTKLKEVPEDACNCNGCVTTSTTAFSKPSIEIALVTNDKTDHITCENNKSDLSSSDGIIADNKLYEKKSVLSVDTSLSISDKVPPEIGRDEFNAVKLIQSDSSNIPVQNFSEIQETELISTPCPISYELIDIPILPIDERAEQLFNELPKSTLLKTTEPLLNELPKSADQLLNELPKSLLLKATEPLNELPKSAEKLLNELPKSPLLTTKEPFLNELPKSAEQLLNILPKSSDQLLNELPKSAEQLINELSKSADHLLNELPNSPMLKSTEPIFDELHKSAEQLLNEQPNLSLLKTTDTFLNELPKTAEQLLNVLPKSDKQLLNELPKSAEQLLNELPKSAEQLLNELPKSAEQLLNELPKSAEQFLNELPKLAEQLLNELSKSADNLLNELPTSPLLKATAPLLNECPKSSEQCFNELPKSTEPLINELPKSAEQLLNELPKSAEQLINELPKSAEQLLNDHPKSAEQLLNDHPKSAEQLLNELPKSAEHLLNEFTKSAEPNSPLLKTTEPLLNELPKSAEQVLNELPKAPLLKTTEPFLNELPKLAEYLLFELPKSPLLKTTKPSLNELPKSAEQLINELPKSPLLKTTEPSLNELPKSAACSNAALLIDAPELIKKSNGSFPQTENFVELKLISPLNLLPDKNPEPPLYDQSEVLLKQSVQFSLGYQSKNDHVASSTTCDEINTVSGSTCEIVKSILINNDSNSEIEKSTPINLNYCENVPVTAKVLDLSQIGSLEDTCPSSLQQLNLISNEHPSQDERTLCVPEEEKAVIGESMSSMKCSTSEDVSSTTQDDSCKLTKCSDSENINPCLNFSLEVESVSSGTLPGNRNSTNSIVSSSNAKSPIISKSKRHRRRGRKNASAKSQEASCLSVETTSESNSGLNGFGNGDVEITKQDDFKSVRKDAVTCKAYWSVKGQKNILADKPIINEPLCTSDLEREATPETEIALSDSQSLISQASLDSGQGSIEVEAETIFTNLGLPSASEQYIFFQFEIPQAIVGRLIGRRGAFINKIKAATSTSVIILEHKNRALKLCSIEGKKSQVVEALKIVRDHFPLDQFPDLPLTEVISPLASPKHQLQMNRQILQVELPAGVVVEVQASAVNSTGEVWLQQPLHPSFSALDRLHQCMNLNYGDGSTTPPVPLPISPNTVCVCQLGHQWLRCQVIDHDQTSCTVTLLDFGESISLPVNLLRQIRMDYIALPFQASQCFLYGIQPINGNSWDEAGRQSLEEMIKNTIIFATIAAYSQDGIPLVNLYQRHYNQYTYINEKMVEKGHARWMATDVIECS